MNHFLFSTFLLFVSWMHTPEVLHTETSLTLRSREEIIDDYLENFVGAYASGGWTGSVRDCDPGDIPQRLRKVALQRLNYFRRQVGYGRPLALGSELGQRAAQEAALIFRANPHRPLNHAPPKHWRCWSPAGALASKGNLFRSSRDRGGFAVWAVGFFMEDPGAENIGVGHRSWFLQPNISRVAVGATGNTVTIWWREDNRLPADAPEFVSWPPQGYVLDDLAYSRWSFHVVARAQYVNASKASVRMFRLHGRNRQSQALRIIARKSNNWFLGGLVWEPKNLLKPAMGEADISYEVIIDHVLVRGKRRDFRYTVTLIDAESKRRRAGIRYSELDKPLAERRNLYID